MPTDFTNIIFDKIMQPVSLLINNEFSIPVNFDEHKGNQSFVLSPQSDTLVNQLSYGSHREYGILISYQLKFGGAYTKTSIKQVSSIMERLKKLINSNTISSSGSEFFEARIASIEYERDEEDSSLLRGVAVFNCQNIEVL